MPQLKEFKTAAETAAHDIDDLLPGGRPLKFRLNSREMVATPPPNSGPFGYLIAMQADDADPSDAAYATLQFVTSLLDQEDAQFVRKSLSTGELDFETLGELFTWLIEEWSARPTTPPRASSSRRRTTGRSSTAITQDGE